MFQINSLRFRIALIFALFGAVLCLVIFYASFMAMQNIGHRLVDEVLQTELDELAERYTLDPFFIPPHTATVKAYIHPISRTYWGIPEEIKDKSPGSYTVNIGESEYRILVDDFEDARYFLMFDTSAQLVMEMEMLRLLTLFAVIMTFCSSLGGFWLASRILAPVSRLAAHVSQSEPGKEYLSLTKLARNDEVGDLARAFERYMRRLEEFVEREGYFTADVSHELRTPLAIILGSVEMLEQDDALSTKQKERIERIGRAVHDMIELTNALLLMTHEHLPSADEQPCEVGEVVLSCIEKHQHLIGKRPIRLETKLDAELNLIVERPLLEIVIGNLIRNALFHTESGTVLLRLQAERLIVQDSGMGMHPEELAHALERHFKGPSSAGAGVGLSLVKRICDRYGWDISLQSTRGQGTTAQVDFSAKHSSGLPLDV